MERKEKKLSQSERADLTIGAGIEELFQQIEYEIKSMDRAAIIDRLKEKDIQKSGNTVVEYAQVECSKMKDKAVMVRIRSLNNFGEARNGSKPLVDTDILFEPKSFGVCKNGKKCIPDIVLDKWKGCDTNNLINGKPSVIMTSFMVCDYAGGIITPITDGQEIKDEQPTMFVSQEYITFLMSYESGGSTAWQYAHEPGDGTVTIAHGVVIKNKAGEFPLGEDVYNYYMDRKEKEIPLSDKEASELTLTKIVDYADSVQQKIMEEGWDVSQNRFDAMVDMVWNLGGKAMEYRAFELLATGDFSNSEQKKELEKEILETAHFEENKIRVWSKNLTERRLDIVQIAEGGEHAYEINPMTNKEWNENGRQLFLDKGVDPKIVDKYPFQKV